MGGTNIKEIVKVDNPESGSTFDEKIKKINEAVNSDKDGKTDQITKLLDNNFLLELAKKIESGDKEALKNEMKGISDMIGKLIANETNDADKKSLGYLNAILQNLFVDEKIKTNKENIYKNIVTKMGDGIDLTYKPGKEGFYNINEGKLFREEAIMILKGSIFNNIEGTNKLSKLLESPTIDSMRNLQTYLLNNIKDTDTRKNLYVSSWASGKKFKGQSLNSFDMPSNLSEKPDGAFGPITKTAFEQYIKELTEEIEKEQKQEQNNIDTETILSLGKITTEIEKEQKQENELDKKQGRFVVE